MSSLRTRSRGNEHVARGAQGRKSESVSERQEGSLESGSGKAGEVEFIGSGTQPSTSAGDPSWRDTLKSALAF